MIITGAQYSYIYTWKPSPNQKEMDVSPVRPSHFLSISNICKGSQASHIETTICFWLFWFPGTYTCISYTYTYIYICCIVNIYIHALRPLIILIDFMCSIILSTSSSRSVFFAPASSANPSTRSGWQSSVPVCLCVPADLVDGTHQF